MFAGQSRLIALGAMLWMLGSLLPGGHVRAAARPVVAVVSPGARIGIVNLLDAEVTHFHAARKVQDGFLKTYAVNWSVSAMLGEAVRERLAQLNLTAVPVAPGETLTRAREDCFLNANLEKSLAKECAAAYSALAASQHLAALIVLGPGLNNSTHAQSTRRKDLPEYLRGWCVLTDEGTAAPLLLNLTELLLIGTDAKGAAVLAAREWGGAQNRAWDSFSAPTDLKALSEAQLNQLQPLYAALLKAQAASLLAHLQVTP